MHRNGPLCAVHLDADAIESRGGAGRATWTSAAPTSHHPARAAALTQVTLPPTDAAALRRGSTSGTSSHDRRTRSSVPSRTARRIWYSVKPASRTRDECADPPCSRTQLSTRVRVTPPPCGLPLPRFTTPPRMGRRFPELSACAGAVLGREHRPSREFRPGQAWAPGAPRVPDSAPMPVPASRPASTGVRASSGQVSAQAPDAARAPDVAGQARWRVSRSQAISNARSRQELYRPLTPPCPATISHFSSTSFAPASRSRATHFAGST